MLARRDLPVADIVSDNRRIISEAGSRRQGNTEAELMEWFLTEAFFAVQWRATERYLDYMVDQFRSRGIKVLILNLGLWHLKDKKFPTLNQLSNVESPEEANELHRKHAGYKAKFVEEWCRRRKLPFFSTNALFSAAKPGVEALLIYGDGHFSPHGHRYLADALQPWLKAQLQVRYEGGMEPR